MEFEERPGLYYIRNLTNNKMYIGESVNVRRRIFAHKSYLLSGTHSNQYLQRSYNKHGLESFEFGIITYCTAENLCDYEIKLIDLYNTKAPNGYNLTDGGEGTIGVARDESTYIRKKVILLNNDMVFDSCKEAADYVNTESSIGQCCKGTLSYAGVFNNNPCVWMWLSEYEQLSDIQKGEERNAKLAKAFKNYAHDYDALKIKVVCLNNGLEFDSMKDAARWANLSDNAVVMACNGMTKSAGKLDGEPMYWLPKEQYDSMSSDDIEKYISELKLIRFTDNKNSVVCMNTGVAYNSMAEAARQTGCSKACISACCRKRISSTTDNENNKYVWIYLSEYNNMSDVERTAYFKDKYNARAKSQMKKVICINTNKVYDSIIDASEASSVNKTAISACCRGVLKHAGRDSATGKMLSWKFV